MAVQWARARVSRGKKAGEGEAGVVGGPLNPGLGKGGGLTVVCGEDEGGAARRHGASALCRHRVDDTFAENPPPSISPFFSF